MIFKYSLKSLFRTPFRTFLFLILIAVVTAMMILGVNMRVTSDNLLEEADNKFDTVATLEYIGKDYPNDSKFDVDLDKLLKEYDFEKLKNAPYVLDYEPNIRLRAKVDNFVMKVLDLPYKDISIIEFRVLSVNEKENYAKCMLLRNYYAYDARPEGLTFLLQDYANIDYQIGIRVGSRYVGHGRFVNKGSYYYFFPAVFDTKLITEEDFTGLIQRVYPYYSGSHELIRELYGILLNGSVQHYPVLKDLYNGVDTSEYEWGKFAKYNEAVIWQYIIDTYKALHNSVPVIATDDIETLPEFHQGKVIFKEGGAYTAVDGANAVVISDTMANQLKLKVGDTIELSMHYAKNNADYLDSYWSPFGFDHVAEYKITGIYKSNTEVYANIYIPQTGNEAWLPEYTNGYKLGRFLIKNGYGMEFIEEIKPYLESRMVTTAYDQGYMPVSQPLKAMRETSIILLAATSGCCVAILFLFAFIFITKHKSNIKIMLSLGTGERRARSYLFLSVLVLAIVSVALGAALGHFLSDTIIQTAYETAEQNNALDLRYSLIYMQSGTVDFQVNFNSDYRYALMVGGGMLILLLLISLAFMNSTLNFDRFNEYKTVSARMRRFIGAFRHSFVSIFRNIGRSIIVPLVSATLVLLLIVYATILSDNKAKIDGLYDTVPARAYFTSLNGRDIDGLLLSGELAKDIVDTGFVKSVSFSYSARYRLLGYYFGEPDENGEQGFKELYKLVIPEGQFAYEDFIAEVFDWDKLVFTNNIYTAPEFFFANEPQMNFLKGYDASVFNKIEQVCAVSSGFALEHNLKLGDKIKVSTASRTEDGYIFNEAELTIVCIYAKQGSGENIYCPAPLLSTRMISYNFQFHTPEGRYELKFDEETQTYYIVSMVYVIESRGDASELFGAQEIEAKDLDISAYTDIHSLSFELKNKKNLSELKAYLEEKGYSSRGRWGNIRKCIAIDDNALILAVSGLNKNVGYMEALYPVIFTLVVAIGFVVSYLLTKSRRAELAVMRSMGAGKLKTFFILFIEQLILCIFGAIIGILASLIFTNTFVFDRYISIAIYLGCYTLGIAISAMLMNRLNVLKILTAND